MVEISIFISSKMQELAPERQLLFDFLPLLNNGMVQLKPWIFEKDAPATEKSIREVYLKALQNAALYIGLFWNEYGEWTIDEFERAGEWNIPRHIYVKDVEANRRDPKLAEFLTRHGDVEHGITAKWFKTVDELKEGIEQSITTWTYQHIMQRPGDLRARLFRASDEIHELPEYFVGREDERQQLELTLRDKNVRVLIQGFGGEGKTALAAKMASNYVNKTAPVLWLRLGSSSLDIAYEALAAPFDATQDMAKAQGDEKRNLLRALLNRENIELIVLDDAWDNEVLQTISRAIPRTIPVIVTARNLYRVGKTIELGGLLPDDALDLLDKLSGTVDDKDTAYDICEKLGYLAFAIEVAGRTMRENQWSTSEMLPKLKSSHTLEMPYEYRQSGRESVAVLLEQSILSLSEEAQKTFYALGAFFAPSITPELMALYQHPDSEEPPISAIESTLDELQRRALIRYNPATDESVASYQAHDLSYSYSATQLANDKRNKALDVCLRYTKRYNKVSRENFAKLVPELDNFIGAASFAMQQLRYSDVEQLVSDLVGSPGFLVYRGYYTQATTLLQQAANAAAKAGNKRNQGIHLSNLGNAYDSLGQYEQAIDYYQQALALSREIGNKAAVGSILGNLGDTYRQLGQYEQVIDYVQQALAIAEENGDIRNRGTQLGSLGLVYANLGQYKQAIDYFKQALAIAEASGDIRSKGNSLGNLSNAYYASGQYEMAIQNYLRVLEIANEIGDLFSKGNVLGNLGNAYDSLGQYEQAIDYYQQALAIAKEIGDRLSESNWLNDLGVCYEHVEDYEQAVACCEQAAALYRSMGVNHHAETAERNLERVKQKLDGAKGSSIIKRIKRFLGQ